MEVWVWWVAGAVVFFSIVIYLLFMVFLPEWVGITGKVALEAERAHEEDSQAEDSKLLEKLHEDKKP